MRRNLFYTIMLAVSLMLHATILPAQEQDLSSMIFRGRVAVPRPSGYNGTPYWDETGFKEGRIMFNGKLYEGVLLRLDSSTGQVQVRPGFEYSPLIPERDQVSWLERDGVKYVNLEYQGVKGCEPGFYEVVADGDGTVFKRVYKQLVVHAGDNSMSLGYTDPSYDRNNPSFFQYSVKYFLLSSDGTFSRIVRRRQFPQYYPREAAALKKHLRKAQLTSRGVPAEAYFKEAISFIGHEGTSTLESLLDDWHPVEGSGTDIRKPEVYAARPANRTAFLPDGYFAPVTEEDALGEGGGGLNVTFRNKVYEIGRKREDPPARAVVTGIVMDGQFDGPLPGAVVSDSLSGTYTVTDARGAWKLDLPTGANILNFQAEGKEDMHLIVSVNGDGELLLTMNVKATELDAALVSDESRMNHRTAQMGLERLSIKTVNKLPSAFGEGDVLKAVLTIPGVKTVGEASGGFNVRGGSSDQNLVLFNEGTIYNPSHLFGIFSAFNPDIIADVMLYKSSIPAEYGGRISSVLQVDGKTGDMQEVKGSLGIGLVTSRFHLEGPLRKGRTTFLVGGRTTYSDWLLGRLPKNSAYSDGKASFSDVNITLNHVFGQHTDMQVFGYYSSDRFAFNKDNTFDYSNLNAALRLNHSFDNGLEMTVSSGIDHFGNKLWDYTRKYEAYTLETGVDQAFARLKFKRGIDAHSLSYGVNATLFSLAGGKMDPLDTGEGDNAVPEEGVSKVLADDLGRENAAEAAIYISDSWQPGGKLSLEGGVRLGAFYNMHDGSFNAAPEFRVSGKWSFTPSLSVKAGVNSLRQNIHLISNSAAISPMDTWKLSGSSVRPTDGWQAASGVYWTVFGGQLDLSLEAYYKRMKNYLDYRSGATLVMNRNLAADLVPTNGKAYGVEIMAKRTLGKLTGWLGYNYSRTFLRDESGSGISAINGGDWYPAAFDKPHDIKFVGNYAFTKRYSVSVNADYSTGRPVTLPVGKFTYGGGNRLLYSSRNGYRLADYFRLDLAVNIDPGHYLKALAHASVTIGCYNVTGRRNAYSVYYTTSGGGDVRGYLVSVFAVPVPYINLNILF